MRIEPVKTTWESFPDHFHSAIEWLKQRWRTVTCITAAVLVVVASVWAVWFFFLATHKQGAEIQSFEWRRGIEVEDYEPRHLGKWADEVPSDAYDRNTYSRYWFTSQICTSTGKTTICVPIVHYRDWTDYTVDRWETIDWLVTTNPDHYPVWHGVESEGFNSDPVFGNRRVGDERFEKYTVYFDTSTGKVYHADTSLTQWSAVDVNEGVNLNLNRQDSIWSINWPKGDTQ